MLNHFAAVMVCGSTNGAPDAGVLPTLVSICLYIEKRSAAFAADCLYRRPVVIEAAAVEHDDQIPLGVGVSGLVPEFDPTPANNLVNNYLEY